MRIIVFSVLLAYSCNVKPQKLSADSLRKYSYNIVGSDDKGYLSGTGFFIRDSNKVFFITAMHVLLGCNSNNKKDSSIPDVISINLVSGIDKGVKLISFDIADIKRNDNCYYVWQQLDVKVIEMPLSMMNDTANIFSVESFIGKPFKMEGEIQVFGFPAKISRAIPNEYHHHPASNIQTSVSATVTLPTQLARINQIDSFNYRITDESQHFIESDLKGFSGSPVFMVNPITRKWQLIGLLSSGCTNSLIVPAIQHIMKRVY